MGYRRDLWELAASYHGVFTIPEAIDAGIPAVEVRKLASRGALQKHGQGVYTHNGVPSAPETEFAVAVALVGEGAYLQRESVFGLLNLGQFNPKKIRVGTHRRVRRSLPAWIDLQQRAQSVPDLITEYKGIPATSVRTALQEMVNRMPRERWLTLVDQSERQDYITAPERQQLVGRTS